MVKLKLTIDKLDVLCHFNANTCTHIEREIEKLMFRKKTLERLQMNVQLVEMRNFKKKLETLALKKMGIDKNKLFVVTLSPIQCLLILTYTNNYLKSTKQPYCVFIINEQKDSIFKELLTK